MPKVRKMCNVFIGKRFGSCIHDGMNPHVLTNGTALHVNLIVTSWSVLCRTHTRENNQVQMGKVACHVLPDNKNGK